METKKDIRKRVLAERSALTEEEWMENSRCICEKITAHPFFADADEIYCYVDYNREAGTRAVMRRAWELGKKTAVPKVMGDEMDFYYIETFDELEEGYFHIPEPVTNRAASGTNVLVIMPGAVFDKNRSRIGYGKGFYDRYLGRHTEYRTMAAAFELQVLDAIPSECHDIRPEIIVTEEKIYV